MTPGKLDLEELEDILVDIIRELGSATHKFPDWPQDPLHAVAVLSEEVGELVQAILQYVYEGATENIYAEAIQVGAMVVRFLLNMDYYRFIKSPPCVDTDSVSRGVT